MRFMSGLKFSLAAGLSALCATQPVLADHHGSATSATAAARQADVPYVRPDTRAYLDRLNANPRPPMTRAFIAMVRKAPPELLSAAAMGDHPVGDLGEVRDVTMPGPGGPMQLRLFDPRAAADRKPGPVVVFYHGGAFTLGSIGTHSGLTAEIARQLDLPVVSVEYRLAPEHPWPAAPDDAEAATRWIAANAKAFGREFTGLVLSGDSAGGNLTLVTAMALRDKPAVLPLLLQVPIYPAADRSKPYASASLFASGYGLDLAGIEKEDLYQADPKHWRTSPLLFDLRGLAPTVLVTASLDPLRDEGRAYAAKLVEAGVPTLYYEADGLIHGFATYRKAIPSAQDDTVRFLALTRAMLDKVAPAAR